MSNPQPIRARRSSRQSSGRTRSTSESTAGFLDHDENGMIDRLSDQDLSCIASIVQRKLSTASQCQRVDTRTRRLLDIFDREASFDLNIEALSLSFSRRGVAQHVSGRSYPSRFDMSPSTTEEGATTYHVSGLKVDTTRSSSIKKHLGSELICSSENDIDVEFDLRLWPEVRTGWDSFPGAAEAFTTFLLEGGEAQTLRVKLGRIYIQVTADCPEKMTVKTAFTRLSRNRRDRVLDADENGDGFTSIQATILGHAEVSLCFGRPPDDRNFSAGDKTIYLRLQLRPVREVTARATSTDLLRRGVRTVQKFLSL